MANENDTSFKRGYFTELKGEFHKIIWPEKSLLVRQSIAVILSAIGIGVIIALIDWVMQMGLSFIVG